ncbi:hypothetical protein PG984_011486 [Apiospora sp. TS-2023a]
MFWFLPFPFFHLLPFNAFFTGFLFQFFGNGLLWIFGFGPLGPIAGSFAAWVQATFFGAAVPAGSFFAFMQSWAMS